MPGKRKHFTRGLRFMLTASYALFFTLMFTVVAVVFRQNLALLLDRQIRDGLDQDWAAMKGYLRIERGVPHWYADPHDPDEASIVGRLRRVYLLTDANGREMQGTEAYRTLGVDSPEEIRQALASGQTRFRESMDAKGTPFVIRSGMVYDEDRKDKFFVAIGRSNADNRKLLRGFTWLCMRLIPLTLLGGCVLGWVFAGRALSPVLSVARTAQSITSSNLSLRIPPRQSGDELDYLIETLNQMIARLENSFRQIRQFSTDVSHELRTPLTILRGQLEVALMTAKTSDQYRDAIVDSLQDIERLSQIVRALLLLSQAETGQVILQRQMLDLSTLVTELCEQFQIPAEGAGVTLSAAVPVQAVTAAADRVQIERMLSNLLSNAMKFTPPGGKVEVELRQVRDVAQLTVCDTGRGIPPEHLPHIFDRFYRVGQPSPESPEKGLGLGLSFVAWIVKAHGGTIDVQSEPGKGTNFRIELPLEAPEAATPNATAAIAHV